MNPELQYLVTARDIVIDVNNGELVLIRIFDTIFIPKGLEVAIYTFNVGGRIFLNATGMVTSQVKIRLLDPDDQEIRTEVLNGVKVNATIGVNINAQFFLIPFKKEGKYFLEVSVNVDGSDFMKIGSPAYFWVKKII